MLKHRIITAIIIIIPVLWLIWYGTLEQMMYFGGALILLAGLEWAQFSKLSSVTGNQVYLTALLIAMTAMRAFVGYVDDGTIRTDELRYILIIVCALWIALFFWIKGYPLTSEHWRGKFIRLFVGASRSSNNLFAYALLWYSSIIRGLLGIVILSSLWISLVAIKGQDNGHWLLVWLLAIVVTADTGAYFSGRRWGKNKLAPNVSPGKSWEGVYGGLAANVVLSLVIGLSLSLSFTMLIGFILTAVVTGAASVLGDLNESMLKRDQAIKDSGSLLPGHGGIMDRIDSLTAAGPVFALSLIFMGWL